MARTVVIGPNTFKRRSPLGVWLGLPLITLGIYYFVWYYKINNEARRYLTDESIRPGISLLAITLGGFLIVPPFISYYNTGKRVRRMQEHAGIAQRVEPWVGLLLMFLWSLGIFYWQYHLNKIWDAYLGQAQPAIPVPPPAITPGPAQS
ncbi:MAG TPA: DUF4234 domain-containing protein [Candidatus Solibacter sp.]|jgi:drug/metabolite transporter (DMT)-like permease|nr:DUF4234 domain-containing protein [Candidatus Solibacter sp.]